MNKLSNTPSLASPHIQNPSFVRVPAKTGEVATKSITTQKPADQFGTSVGHNQVNDEVLNNMLNTRELPGTLTMKAGVHALGANLRSGGGDLIKEFKELRPKPSGKFKLKDLKTAIELYPDRVKEKLQELKNELSGKYAPKDIKRASFDPKNQNKSLEDLKNEHRSNLSPTTPKAHNKKEMMYADFFGQLRVPYKPKYKEETSAMTGVKKAPNYTPKGPGFGQNIQTLKPIGLKSLKMDLEPTINNYKRPTFLISSDAEKLIGSAYKQINEKFQGLENVNATNKPSPADLKKLKQIGSPANLFHGHPIYNDKGEVMALLYHTKEEPSAFPSKDLKKDGGGRNFLQILTTNHPKYKYGEVVDAKEFATPKWRAMLKDPKLAVSGDINNSKGNSLIYQYAHDPVQGPRGGGATSGQILKKDENFMKAQITAQTIEPYHLDPNLLKGMSLSKHTINNKEQFTFTRDKPNSMQGVRKIEINGETLYLYDPSVK